jgi:hypothetical protein
MEDVAAIGNGLRPAGVLRQVGGDDIEPVAGSDAGRREVGAELVLATEVADGGADVVAALEELDDGPFAEEAGSSGDEYAISHGG